MSDPTIIDLKKAFLTSQLRILNTPLVAPPPPTAAGVARTGEGDGEQDEDEEVLREKVVAEVLTKLNATLRHHNRASYSSQAVRHVAEQIDALYWASGEAPRDTTTLAGSEALEDVLEKGADLTSDKNIAALPEHWPEDRDEGDGHEEDGETKRARYAALQNDLKVFSAQREESRQKLERYRKLQQLLEPFKDPRENVQPNLVTRDGELGQELERMRMLMARVAGRIEGLKGQPGSRPKEATLAQRSEQEKLQELLGEK